MGDLNAYTYKSILVIANETENLGLSNINVGDLMSGVQDITLETGTDGADAFSSLMTGKLENVELVKGVNNRSITLRRVVAKVTIQLKKQLTEDVDVIIESVSLNKNSLITSLWGSGSPISNQEYLNFTQTFNNLSLTEDYSDLITFFVFENLGNSAGNLANATELIVKGTYGGTPVLYQAYINSGSNEDSYKIERNTHYEIKGNIKAARPYNDPEPDNQTELRQAIKSSSLFWNVEQFRFIK